MDESNQGLGSIHPKLLEIVSLLQESFEKQASKKTSSSEELAQQFKLLKEILQVTSEIQTLVGREKTLTGRALGKARSTEALSSKTKSGVSNAELLKKIEDLEKKLAS
jgi:hypothetical protein